MARVGINLERAYQLLAEGKSAAEVGKTLSREIGRKTPFQGGSVERALVEAGILPKKPKGRQRTFRRLTSLEDYLKEDGARRRRVIEFANRFQRVGKVYRLVPSGSGEPADTRQSL